MFGGGGPGDQQAVCICGYYPLYQDTPQMSGSNAAGPNNMCHTFFGQDYYMPQGGNHNDADDTSCPDLRQRPDGLYENFPYDDITDSTGDRAMCHSEGAMCAGGMDMGR